MAHGAPGEPGADPLVANVPGHPSLPVDMEGAIDLNDPVQVMLTNFRAGVLKGGATACIAVARMPDGNVAISFHAPGGLVEVLGMLAASSGMIANQNAQRGTGTQ